MSDWGGWIDGTLDGCIDGWGDLKGRVFFVMFSSKEYTQFTNSVCGALSTNVSMCRKSQQVWFYVFPLIGEVAYQRWHIQGVPYGRADSLWAALCARTQFFHRCVESMGLDSRRYKCIGICWYIQIHIEQGEEEEGIYIYIYAYGRPNAFSQVVEHYIQTSPSP